MKSHDWMTRNGLSDAGDGKASNRFSVGQMKSFRNGVEYWIHPVYDLYGANKQGEVINVDRGVPMKGYDQHWGYKLINVRGSRDRKQKCVHIHRFIYECYNGLIPDGMVIGHINDIKDDNRLKNLQLMTQQQNSKKSAKNQDYSNKAANFKSARKIKATNLETNEISYFDSMGVIERSLGINRSNIGKCSRGINHRKTSTSKKDGCKYAFEYA